MAESNTTRLSIRRWTADGDTPQRTDFDTSFANLESRVAGWVAPNTLANRPAAAAAYDRFLFHAHDTDQLFMCVDTTGASAFDWVEIPLGSSVAIQGTEPSAPETDDLWIDTSV